MLKQVKEIHLEFTESKYISNINIHSLKKAYKLN